MEALDLRIAHPPSEMLPSGEELMAWAGSFASNRAGLDLVGYGEHAGLGEARIAIAEWLTTAYAGKWEPSGLELVLCAGVSGGISVCACGLHTWLADGSQMGSVALVEGHTYELAPPILEGSGLEVVRVRSDQDGVDPEAVEAEVRKRGGAGGGPGAVRLLYLVPVHGNPTGATLSPARRAKLIALSQELRFYIVTDEVYGLLGFGSTPPCPLSASASGSIVSLGSVSKLLAPGLRVGWIHCPDNELRKFLADVPVAISGGSPVPALAAAAVAGAAEDGCLVKRTESARLLLADRARALTTALDAVLEGTGARLWPCTGGYFLWIELPSVEIASEVAACLEKGDPCVLVGVLENAAGLRLCFAGLSCEDLGIAAELIGSAVRLTEVALSR
mmetsp:Transcript_76147/g.140159  ORF Transcript_76147/g.140159 Transcript_76147/m.140159 type:complete len:390 (+) Transcript_76147:74-1243(+)